ncbi:MAG: hypothetical protein GY849_12175 [Deltaproteobacteria bacterium]|nr:hypothetical protein [Deltaproteobacteria bacterium]
MGKLPHLPRGGTCGDGLCQGQGKAPYLRHSLNTAKKPVAEEFTSMALFTFL